jgi:hypothetical protein
VHALVEWLPTDAAFWRATGTAWTTEAELAAVQIELLDSIRRMYLQAHSKKGTQPPKPLHVPRPWDTKTSSGKRGTTLSEMIAVMKLPIRVEAED